MISSEERAAGQAYWRAAGGEGDSPFANGEDAVQALRATLARRGASSGGWTLEGAAAVFAADPWPAMALGTARLAEAELAWALAAAELVVLGRTPAGGWLVLDPVRDASRQHRAFAVSPAGQAMAPRFRGLAELLRWAAVVTAVERRAAPPGALRDALEDSMHTADAWDRGVRSAEGTLAALLVRSPATLYAAHQHRRPFAPPPARPQAPPAPAPVAPREGDPPRLAMLWTLARFCETRAVALPPGVAPEALAPVHQELLERLEDLAAAASRDEVPGYIAWLGLDDAPETAGAAAEWVAQFDQARAAPAEPVENPREALAREIYKALAKAVRELSREGELELESDSKNDDLAEDVLQAVLGARSVKDAARAAARTVLESPHVAEVFADDDTLERAFLRALAGGA